ncbi:putative trypsin-like serine protease, partial [Operophtera brumata]
EFFQRFSSIIQPYQTTRRNDLVTKRPTNKQASRQGYQDTIFFETDDFLKEKESGLTDPFTTTVKPRRKKIKTTAKPSTRNPWYQESTERNTERNNNIYYERTTNIYNNQAIIYDDRQTERPAVFNNNFNVAQKPINSRPIFSSHTTVNPLLNRPGVRPAVVDDGRPPITNKPVPYTTQRPVLSNRPNAGNEECDEYKSLNTKKVVALPLATLHASQGVELNVSSCSPVNIPLIIGGKVVSIQEFPHMSLVGWKNIQRAARRRTTRLIHHGRPRLTGGACGLSDPSPEIQAPAVLLRLPIWDMGECREIWGTSRKLPEGPSPASQLCAGERGGGRRSCGAADTPALYAKIPRAFIASLVFSNVKLSNNRNNNDNRYNGNNNGNIHGNNNWDVSANGFNNQGVASTQNFGNSRP